MGMYIGLVMGSINKISEVIERKGVCYFDIFYREMIFKSWSQLIKMLRRLIHFCEDLYFLRYFWNNMGWFLFGKVMFMWNGLEFNKILVKVGLVFLIVVLLLVWV